MRAEPYTVWSTIIFLDGFLGEGGIVMWGVSKGLGKCNSMTSLLTQNVAHSTRHSFRPKTNNQPLKKFLSLALSKSCQKLDVILENKVSQKLKFPKNVNNKKCAPKIILFNEIFF